MADDGPGAIEEMEDVKDIAPDGDVILVVGSGKVKMRVSSVLLANASPVFKAMFGPHFREGQKLRDVSSSSALEIPLPDDNWRPMNLLCKMAHLSCEQGEKFDGLHGLYLLATLIDKYCCAGPLRPQSSAFLWVCLQCSEGEKVPIHDLWCLVSAAYLMDCSQAFKVATSRFIGETKGDFLTQPVQDIRDIPGNIIGMILEKRGALWRRFCRALPDLGIPKCDACGNVMQSLASSFKLRYWPPSFEDGSLGDLLARTRKLTNICRGRNSCQHTGGFFRVTNESFCQAAQKIEAECQGLCLVCTKAGRGGFGGACQEHKWNL